MQIKFRWMMAWALVLMLGGAAWAQKRKAEPGASGEDGPARVAGPRQMAQWRRSVDAGDAYPTPRGNRTLRRSLDRVVVRGATVREQAQRAAAVKNVSAAWRDAQETAWGPGSRMRIRPGCTA